MLYAGLDVGKSFSQAILMTETGVVKEEKTETSEEGMRRFFGQSVSVRLSLLTAGLSSYPLWL